MAEKLQINTIDRNGSKVLQVAGEIDLYTVESLQVAVNEQLEAGVRNLIVDLTDTHYLDSSGLSALLAAHRKLMSRQSALSVVVAPSKQSIARIFQITRLDTVFHIFDSLESALESNTPQSV